MEPIDSMLTTNMKANIRIDDINGTTKFFRNCPEFKYLAKTTLKFLQTEENNYEVKGKLIEFTPNSSLNIHDLYLIIY